MVRPLSMDLRERAVARIAAGESVRKVALALSVAPSSVVKWTQRLRVDYRTVWTFIRREGLSFKKNRAGERAKPSRRRPQAQAVEDPPGAH